MNSIDQVNFSLNTVHLKNKLKDGKNSVNNLSNLNTSIATDLSSGFNEILYSHIGTPGAEKNRNLNLPFL